MNDPQTLIDLISTIEIGATAAAGVGGVGSAYVSPGARRRVASRSNGTPSTVASRSALVSTQRTSSRSSQRSSGR